MTKANLLFICIVLSGCVSAIPMTPAPLVKEQSLTPKVGSESESLLGSPMIVRDDVVVSMAYVAVKDYIVPVDALSSTKFDPIVQGSKWKVIGGVDSNRIVIKNENYRAKSTLGLGTPNPYQSLMCFVITPSGQITGHAWCDGSPSMISINAWSGLLPGVFEAKGKNYEAGSFRQELIYNGKGGTVIRLSYREYSNDMARPAFTQELSYDLAEGKSIGFRGMNIDIIEATNTGIKYIIKSPMK